MWLHNNDTVVHVTWPFIIFDLPISYGEELKAVVTKYLTEGMGFTKAIASSTLHESKNYFSLGTIVTQSMKTEVRHMYIAKTILVKDNPSMNGLGTAVS